MPSELLKIEGWLVAEISKMQNCTCNTCPHRITVKLK
jgi:DNA-directed RNA polymerase subunit RPC12/RpoP